MTDWPQFHNTPDRQGFSLAETHILKLNASTIHQIWKAPLGTKASYNSSTPAVVNGIVYAGTETSQSMHAVSVYDGGQVWSFKTGGKVSSSPAVVDGLVYFGSDDGYVYALSAAIGTLVWKFNVGSPVGSPVLYVNGLIYIGANNGFYCLNATTGGLVWSVKNIYQVRKGACYSPEGLVFVASDHKQLYAFDALTGAERWAAPLGGFGRSTPAVNGTTVYVGCYDGRVYAFDVLTGTLRWRTPVLGMNIPCQIGSSPALAYGYLYITTNEGLTAGEGVNKPLGHTYCLDQTNGKVVWAHTLPDMSGFSPVVFNGMVWTSGCGHGLTQVLDAFTGNVNDTPKFLWSSKYPTPFGGQNYGSAAVADGRVYFLNSDGYLYCYGV